MKKFWKVLGITALAAAVVPYRFRKDEETGEKTIDALLWQVTRGPGQGEDKEQIDISLGFKSPFQELREEKELFTDDPEEAVLFADDDPQAAVVTGEPVPAEAETQGSDEPAVTEADFDPEL